MDSIIFDVDGTLWGNLGKINDCFHTPASFKNLDGSLSFSYCRFT